MRAVVQRVSSAEVRVDGRLLGSIEQGLLVLLAVGASDQERDAAYLANKTLNLRIFEDAEGKMNRSVRDIRGGLLVVSQFTLYANARKGRRPSFVDAARPEVAEPLFERFVATPDRAERLYEAFLEEVGKSGLEIASGRFQAMMDVSLVNQGPVTLLLDSSRAF